jgi:hypothetical protein
MLLFLIKQSYNEMYPCSIACKQEKALILVNGFNNNSSVSFCDVKSKEEIREEKEKALE